MLARRLCALLLVVSTPALAQAPYEEGYAIAGDGVRLYYRKVGSGPVAIVPGRLFVFDDLAALSDRFTVVGYDLRNRGLSGRVEDDSRLGVRPDLRDLDAVRRHVGAAKASIVGYSYIGLLAILYAHEHPDHVERIVQIGPAPMKLGVQYPASLTSGGKLSDFGADPEELAQVRAMMQDGRDKSRPRDFCEKLWSVMRYSLVGDPARVGRLGPGNCALESEWPANLERHSKASMASIGRLDVTPAMLARVRHPVLTIHGRKDRNVAYGAGREWAMKLPDARLVTLPGAAHNPHNEYPEVVVPLLREFLGGAWPAGAEKVERLEP